MFTKKPEDWHGGRMWRRECWGSRVDFRDHNRMDETQGLMRLRGGARPGMTKTSPVPARAARAGRSFEELVRWMAEDVSVDR
jgi:D-alanine-D-alanine ligase